MFRLISTIRTVAHLSKGIANCEEIRLLSLLKPPTFYAKCPHRGGIESGIAVIFCMVGVGSKDSNEGLR